jgi:hypothetical protein
VAKATCKSLTPGVPYKFALVDQVAVRIVLADGADPEKGITLKVKPPLAGEITYTTACGKFLPIVTRYQTKNDERLIIAIMVKPCPRTESGCK